MAFLQQRIFNPAGAQAPSLNKSSGFFTVGLLCFLGLMLLTLIGFSLLSVGIKNITGTQSSCFRELILTQKELGKNLTQLLKLNQKSRNLNKSREALEAAIKAALVSIVLAPEVPSLKKMRSAVKDLQKVLIFKQKQLLIQSLAVKRKGFQKLTQKLSFLKASSIQELTFYKPALAVEKEKIGADSYIYKPVQDFKQKQKILVFWRLSPFHPLEKDLKWFLPAEQVGKSQYNCAATLQKKGEKWVSLLYH